MANIIRPSVIIGKNGITANVLKDIDAQLEANELVKIHLLESNGLDPKQSIADICDLLDAEFVSQLGAKLVIYRQSEDVIIDLSE